MTTPPQGFDLSKLPEPLRSKLQDRLNKLSPEMRQQMLDRGSPILEKVIDRVRDASTPVTRAQAAARPVSMQGHYSRTVMPGDRMHLSLGMIAMVVVSVVALYYLYG